MTRRHAVFLCAVALVAGGLLYGACSDASRQHGKVITPVGPTAVSHGPILGAVTADSAWIWLRTNRAASVAIEHAADATFGAAVRTDARHTEQARDFTAKFLLEGLPAESTRYYRVLLDGALQEPGGGVYEFRTAPGPTMSFSFTVLSDFSGNQPLLSRPAIEALAPDLLVVLGDLDHRNPGDVDTPAEALENMRKMHRQLRGKGSPLGIDFEHLLVLRDGPQIAFLHAWDDHDFGLNNSDRTFKYRAEALQAFDEYFVKAGREGADPARGIWQNLEYGPAELFLLDPRSERDPNDDPASPTKTFLGAEQKSWLKQHLRVSQKRWKLVFSGVPWNPGCKPYDAWGSFQDEQNELVTFIQKNKITGVIIVSGDIHSGGAVDDGTNSFQPEISVPHANCGSFVDTYKGQPGTWSHGILSGMVGAGFVHFEVSPDQVIATVRGEQGEVRILYVAK